MSGTKRKPLLIVEDDLALQKQMRWAFDRNEIIVASDPESAMAQVRRHEPAVVTMDLGLPPHPDDATEGFALLPQILAFAPYTKVIVLTGQNDHANALRAIGLGAYDFYAKPFEPELLGLTIERAYVLYELQEENRRLQLGTQPTALGGILTRDAEMLRICRTAEKVAPTTASILLLGESGTGKELFARALHDLSARKKERFVAINCAAIPESLLESEQAKLLRFLQERVIERVGGREEIPVDVRVVCATHQDLKEMIAQGKFREDLYFRLAEIALEIPPLRARPGDASLLAHAFVHRFAEEQKRGPMTLLPDAVEAIEAHPWPGNVRELENCIKRAVIMSDGAVISAADTGLGGEAKEDMPNLRQAREEAERKAVTRVLGRANGNLTKAAELLGISRPTLYELLDRFGLR